jgi:hypothetical protein
MDSHDEPRAPILLRCPGCAREASIPPRRGEQGGGVVVHVCPECDEGLAALDDRAPPDTDLASCFPVPAGCSD